MTGWADGSTPTLSRTITPTTRKGRGGAAAIRSRTPDGSQRRLRYWGRCLRCGVHRRSCGRPLELRLAGDEPLGLDGRPAERARAQRCHHRAVDRRRTLTAVHEPCLAWQERRRPHEQRASGTPLARRWAATHRETHWATQWATHWATPRRMRVRLKSTVQLNRALTKRCTCSKTCPRPPAALCTATAAPSGRVNR